MARSHGEQLPQGSAELDPEPPQLERADRCWIGRFTAMASPCELLVDTDERDEAAHVAAIAAGVARRIERAPPTGDSAHADSQELTNSATPRGRGS